MLRFLTIFLIVISLTSCDTRRKEEIEGSVDRVGKPINTVVYFYDNRIELKHAYAEIHRIKPHQVPQGIQGFAVWSEWLSEEPENAQYDCIIHTVEPTRVDDNNTLTLGHEMLHCLYGSYH